MNDEILEMSSFMSPLLLAQFWHYFFGTMMFVTSIFLILLILVQRGRGGGLAGAFGGMGGQSAFGTKAGDLFTRITIVAAAFWIVLCIAAIAVLNTPPTSRFGAGVPPAQPTLEATDEQEDGQPGAAGGAATPGPAKASESQTTPAGGSISSPVPGGAEAATTPTEDQDQ